MGLTRCLAVFSFSLFMFGCHLDSPSRESENAERGRICLLGGGNFNSVSNECECVVGHKWSGSRCELDSAAATATTVGTTAGTTAAQAPSPVSAPASSQATETAAVKSSVKEVVPANLVPVPTAAAKVPAKAEPGLSAAETTKLKSACGKAHAQWLDDTKYCQCPEAKVLVGSKCLTLHGAITDDACLRSVRPGKWRKGNCKCASGETFVPQRGGCVAPDASIAAVHKSTCESSLNGGSWEQEKGRCQCPAGRIWVGENCAPRSQLSSAAICESSYNGGNWDAALKRCNCQEGQLWVNQTCQDPHSLPEQVVCESEWNKGNWNKSRKRCSCPRGRLWDNGTMVCLERTARKANSPKAQGGKDLGHHSAALR